MKISLTFLGTGTSHGIPMIACDCDVCTSDNPKNTRYRTSVWLRYGSTSIIIDTPPEFRLQAITHGIRHVNAVLYTHFHADHVHGIDDLRRYNQIQQTSIPCYGTPHTIKNIIAQHAYINQPRKEGGGIPHLDLRPLENSLTIGAHTITPIPIYHGSMPIRGFRIGNIAYMTDCNRIPEKSYEKLTGLDILVIDALRFRPHSTHFTIDQALAEIEKIKPKRAYLTHMCHDIDHDTVENTLPPQCHLAYDGLELSS